MKANKVTATAPTKAAALRKAAHKAVDKVLAAQPKASGFQIRPTFDHPSHKAKAK